MDSLRDNGRDAAGPARFDRRSVLRRSAALTAVTALTVGVLPNDRAAAQAGEATPAASPAPVESGYAPVNGLNLYFEIYGVGEPLVLLHGGLGSIAMFNAVIPGLARTRQLIGVDLQAHGHTADIDRPMTFEAMADDVAALLGYLGIARADLFGFSVGGGVTLQTAIRHAEVVRKLVIASAPFRLDGWHPEVPAGMAQMNADAAAAMVGTPYHQAYVSVAPRPEDWPILVTKVGSLGVNDYDWTEGVRAITAPALVVIGDADSVRPVHALELFELLGGGAPGDFAGPSRSGFAVLPFTAHSAPPAVLDRVEQLLQIIPPFLDAPLA